MSYKALTILKIKGRKRGFDRSSLNTITISEFSLSIAQYLKTDKEQCLCCSFCTGLLTLGLVFDL